MTQRLPRIIFFGTPHFAAEVLDYLVAKNVSIQAVVVQPDRPKGRSRKMQPPPVKVKAQELLPEVKILQPEKASSPESLQELKKIDADLFVVVAYGQILKQNLLDIPNLGCINVHASLLPEYRGAAPIQRVLMNGEKETGVTIMKMVLALDAGDVLASSKCAITENMVFGELEKKLCDISGPLLLEVIEKIGKGVQEAEPQDDQRATFAPKICPQECEIDWGRPAIEIHNLIRALSPHPGAYCLFRVAGKEKRMKIKGSKVVRKQGTAKEILVWEKSQCLIACGKDAIEILELQEEGKKSMPLSQWMLGVKEKIQLL